MRMMQPEARAALQAKFLPVDEPDYTAWCRGVGVEAPPPDSFAMFMEAATG